MSTELGTTDGETLVDDSDNLIGLSLALIAGVIYPFCAITSRMLKDVPTPVILLFHTAGGITLTSLFIIIEALATGNGFRFRKYTS